MRFIGNDVANGNIGAAQQRRPTTTKPGRAALPRSLQTKDERQGGAAAPPAAGHRRPANKQNPISRKAVDNGPGRWEYSHMETTLVKADDKGRVSIRGTRKGAKYLVTAENGGWWIMPMPKITVPE